MKRSTTKIQQHRERLYREQLRLCGFRSWSRANERRCDLIDLAIATGGEPLALAALQRLADLYVTWKTNDQTGRSIRRAERLLNRLEN